MENFNLHSSGGSNHLESLKQRYFALVDKIKGNNSLLKSEKDEALRQAEMSYKKEKKDTKKNLY